MKPYFSLFFSFLIFILSVVDSILWTCCFVSCEKCLFARICMLCAWQSQPNIIWLRNNEDSNWTHMCTNISLKNIHLCASERMKWITMPLRNLLRSVARTSDLSFILEERWMTTKPKKIHIAKKATSVDDDGERNERIK